MNTTNLFNALDNSAFAKDTNELEKIKTRIASHEETLDSLKRTFDDLVRDTSVSSGRVSINKYAFERTLRFLDMIRTNIYQSKSLNKHLEVMFLALNVQEKLDVKSNEFKSCADMYMTNAQIVSMINRLARNEDTDLNLCFVDAMTQAKSTTDAKTGNDKYLLHVLNIATVDSKGIKIKKSSIAYKKVMKLLDEKLAKYKTRANA
jgi:hypothetical protein